MWRSYNVVFRSIAGALALNTAEGAMTTVNCATKPGIKKGALYMPFSIKMSKLFKFNKKVAYDLGMPFLTRPFAGFTAAGPASHCPTRHPTHVEPSLLQLNRTL